MNSWAQQLRAKVEPSLAGPRAFATKIRQARPTLLLIADDDTTRGLFDARTSLPWGMTPSSRVVSISYWRNWRTHVPEAIIMDLTSPAADSVSLTRQLKALPDIAHIPIIIMSGDSRREMLISSIRAGASDFIAKPFTREVLRMKL